VQAKSRSKVNRLLRPIRSLSSSFRSNPLVTYLRHLAINHPNLLSLVKALIVFIIFFIVCFGRFDPDFGWHLMSGNYFRAHGIPAHDIFTYTAHNFRWIDHEWGNDVLMSYLYQVHGYLILALFFAGLWTLGLMINAWRARFVILLIAVAAMLPYIIIRPTAWDVVGLAIFFRILSAKKLGKAILWLPLLLLIWVNLHGGFIIGLAVLLYFAIIRKSKPLLLMFLLCIPVTFINPYGIRLYVEIFRTLTDWSLHHETGGMSMFNLSYPAWALVVLWCAGFWLFAKKKLVNWIGLSPLLLAGSLVATRNIPLFAVVATSELNYYCTQAKDLLPKQLPKLAKNVLRIIVIVIIGLLIAFFLYRAHPTTNREANYPVAAVAYLKTHQCNGNLFNDFNYGGYLIWQLPEYPVFIDGRMPSWRNAEGVKYLDIYSNVIQNSTTRKNIFRQYDIACALFENNAVFKEFIGQLKAAGWKTPITANGSVLLVSP